MRPLKLPTRPARVRAEGKDLWNDGRSVVCADFFTLGYEGRPVTALIDAMQSAGVRSLVDIRHTPVSMYRPEMSKSNLHEAIRKRGIEYLHARECGVPRDIRGKAIEAGSREPIWDWYDTYVADPLMRNLHWFLNLEHPIALMCVERDPVECHRHRLFVKLEEIGLRGYEL